MSDTKVAMIPIAKIRENPVALRPVNKETEQYEGLVDSIKKNGILNAISVREIGDPDVPGGTLYGLIDGLHRYHASMDAGLKEVPVTIKTMDQAAVEEAQIIANVHKIETKPIQYTKQLERLMLRNPLMTVNELAEKLSKTTQWLYERFGLLKLSEDVQKLVDDGTIKLSNAYQLSKLPPEERPNWLDRAMVQDPGEFTASVSARKKELAEARRQGRTAAPPTFQPVVHARKWGEVKEEYESNRVGPQLKTSTGCADTYDAGWRMAVAWVANMDPLSQAEQRAEHEAREKRKKEEAEKRKADRDSQKQQENNQRAASVAVTAGS